MTLFSHSLFRPSFIRAAAAALCLALGAQLARAEIIWTEGEKPVKTNVKRHPWWYDKVNKDLLSGGDFISNWGDKPGTIEYSVTAAKSGPYELWVHANPVGTALSYQLNGEQAVEIDLHKEQLENTNIAGDGKPDVRFIAWSHAGTVTLKEGKNDITFVMHSKNNNHGILDCFVLANQPFEPRGLSKQGHVPGPVQNVGDWFSFDPAKDKLDPNGPIDLRSLNESEAGEGGFIAVKDGEFIHSRTGKPVRFWAVNGPPGEMKDRAQLRHLARTLAKYGVNMIRLHGGIYDTDGKPDPQAIQHCIDIVESMKAEGIYSDFSVYWYGFFHPKADAPFAPGYDGKTAPVASLMFNPDYQKQYHLWYTALMTTPGKVSGKRLIDEPAVAWLEMQNEDSLFFWTFSDRGIPDVEMRIVEKQFGDWLIKKYGSLQSAMEKWHGQRATRDNLAEGRMGFRPTWNVFHERSQRDKDSVAFMTDLQHDFYASTYKFLRDMGFKGVITTSGWTTASPEYFGPLDKYTNTVADYIDRHGYFAGAHKGSNAGWSLRNDQTYCDRSALRFDPVEPGKPKLFSNPVMDPHYDNKPSAISETSFERPNRYRSEAPLYYACYGALQNSNSFTHFAVDSDHYSVKPGYFMQPWTLFSPSTLGQFPAAALLYRQRLVATGDLLVNLNLKISDLKDLKGTPMPQDASLDDLNLKVVPGGTQTAANGAIDPLVHYAGRTNVNFSETGGPAALVDLSPYINRAAQTVTSTTHQLKLDYGKGILTINAPAAQGLSGNLKAAGTVATGDLNITSDLDLGHIIAVSIDGKPLATSSKILLQVMSEDEPSGFRTEDAGKGMKRIVDIGRDPWLVKKLSGTVAFKRSDAPSLKVTALDFNGYPVKQLGTAAEIKLNPDTVYYLIDR